MNNNWQCEVHVSRHWARVAHCKHWAVSLNHARRCFSSPFRGGETPCEGVER